MIKNSLMKFIDSCVGNIARKIEDEFRESDHPRDKGGKFTSKGGEGRGGGNGEEHDEVMSSVRNIMNRALSGNPRDPIMRKRAQKELRKALSKESSSREASSSSSGGLSKGQKELASHIFNAIMTEAIGQNDFDSTKEARDYVRGYIEMMLDDSEGLAENYGISEKEAVAAIKHANKSWKSSTQYKDPWESSYEDPYEDDDDDDEEDDVGEELIQVKRAAKAARRFKSSGIDLASAMEDLDIPTEGVPEKYLESVFEGSLSEDPKLLRKAEDYIERYESGELEKEADRLGSEEDGDDADVSLEQYKKNVSENFDGDEEYEVEARYDRAKYHSDKFKKLQNGEYDGTPEEKRLKNYYRRVGMKKPEDAFKVWWDI